MNHCPPKRRTFPLPNPPWLLGSSNATHPPSLKEWFSLPERATRSKPSASHDAMLARLLMNIKLTTSSPARLRVFNVNRDFRRVSNFDSGWLTLRLKGKGRVA